MPRAPVRLDPRAAAPIYHRLGDKPALIEEIARTGILKGSAPRNIYASDFPAVQAYVGPLPEGEAGFEFTSQVPPDSGSPPDRVCWRGPRDGVVIESD
jgi:hypothetical protein